MKYFLSSFLFTSCLDLSSKFNEANDDNKDDDDDDNDGYSNDHDCSFTPVSGTKIASYDCNPVLQNTGEAWGGDIGSVGFYSSESRGHQLWYTSSPEDSSLGNDNEYGMGFATSRNGSDWTLYENNPILERDPDAWDKDSLAGQVIIWDENNEQYVMAYQGITIGTGEMDPNTLEVDNGTFGLGIATSTDGLEWNKSPNNPVINFTEDFDIFSGATINPCWPLTITLNNTGSFSGYIAATSTVTGSDQCNIYAMNSQDAETWSIEDTAPIFLDEAEYDSKGFASASVIEYEGTLYMFYIGFTEWIENTGYRSASNMSLNLATSTDNGTTWIRDPENPIAITTDTVNNVSAQLVGNRIHLWISDDYNGEQAIGYFFFNPDIENHQ